MNPSNVYNNPISAFLIKVFEGIAILYQATFKNCLPEFSTITTADSDIALVTAEGQLLSGFRIDGIVCAIGATEFDEITLKIANSLRPFLKQKGHTIQIFSSRDQAGVGPSLAVANRGSRATLKQLNLRLDDVLDSREKTLAKVCAEESIYLAVWTHPEVISSVELKLATEKRKEDYKKLPTGMLRGGAQDITSTLGAIRESHEALVSTLHSALGSDKAGFVLSQLSAHEMVSIARREQDPDFTHPEWKPSLPGDKIQGVLRGSGNPRELNIADIQYPPLSWQMFPRDVTKIENKYVQIGDRIFSPVFIEIPPQDIEPFSNLFDKLADVGVPWRVSFTIDGGGMKYTTLRAGMSSFLSFASPYNRKINETVKAMKEYTTDTGATYIRLKVAFCTWAPADDIYLLKARTSKLVNAISSWGDCEVRDVVGAPVEGVYSTIPFLSPESIANYSIAPLTHIARMLPVMRMASPWKSGAVLFRTKDGKLMPFEPGSSKQSTWNYIFFAPPGSGKSVQLANMILAAVMQAGIKQLPRIGIVDVGPSSKGVLMLIREALPISERHKVGYFKLKNTVENAINPFDTFPGCRFPTPEHKAFLVNMLSLLATPAERSESYSSIGEIAAVVIDNVYRAKSDTSRSSPNLYEMDVELEVDQILQKMQFKFGHTSSWWSVVDFLFDQGYTHLSTLAQRHAVPNMSDIPSAAQSQVVKDQYGQPKVDTEESLNAVFSRMINAANGSYPIISSKTKFDLGEIRIASIDINDVAKDGSAADNKQTALMYMLARFVLTKDFKLDAEFAQSDRVPAQYRSYLTRRAIDNKESLKWVIYDEFHRTKGSLQVQNEVLVDMREGRKWNLGVMLASQSLDDFPSIIKELATGVFILKAATNIVADKLQHMFGLNDSTRAMILKYCNGPVAGVGAPLMAHLQLNTGTTDMLLYSTLGPYEMWALTTTAEDVALLERVSLALQDSDPDNALTTARLALSRIFPRGVKSKVEDLRNKMSLDRSSQDSDEGAIEMLTKQVLQSIEYDKREVRHTRS